MSLSSGSRLGPYEILAPLGAGGMGEVYRAKDTRLGRDVAIKVLPEEVSSDPDRMRRFEKEAKAASALNHPNLVTLYEIGRGQLGAYIVMELVDGQTLRELLAGGSLPVKHLLAVAAQAVEGLARAHEAGIIHRDLKPENIMVTRDGFAKILDFGLAKIEGSEVSGKSATHVPTASAGTAAGVVLGTVGYMSPEQASGKPVDRRSDQFSLGSILYEMASGRRAFQRQTAVETLAAIVRDEPPTLADAPEPLRWIIERCLAKDPAERYDSTRDLARDLAAARDRLSEGRPQHFAGPSSRRRTVGLFAVALVALSLAVLWVVRTRSPSPAFDSLAVLPLANAGSDPTAEYLSDGITETLIERLSRLPGMRVISRASVFRYKGKATDPQQVGRELNVRAVLTGSVLRQGEGLTIGVELADTGDGRHLWGERYVRKLSDVLAVQSEITSEICEKLRLRLRAEDRSGLERGGTQVPEAYELYLQGRYFWNRRTPEDLGRAVEFFRQALEKDSGYALAYTGLADAYALRGYTGYGAERPREALPKARAAALEALRIDPRLAEAHTSLAHVLDNYDWNWSEAEREYRRAIELNPNYPPAHQWYALLLASMRRFDEALIEMERAKRVDPLSLIINSNQGWVLYFARRYGESIAQCRRTLEIDPRFGGAHWVLGFSYLFAGDSSKAVAEEERAVELSGENPGTRATLAYAYAVAGKPAEARAILEDLLRLSQRRYVPAFWIATAFAGLGERETAFEWLEKSYQEREGALTLLNIEPRFDSLRPDPRFQDLVRRIGLP